MLGVAVSRFDGRVFMNPTRWLRLEGAAELVLVSWLYARMGASWYLFAALFLAPDISMLGYLVGPRVGAWCYNTIHTYVAALCLLAVGVAMGRPMAVSIALIWCAHISVDRMVGFGLKSSASFRATHLGVMGRPRKGNEIALPSS